jgi:hypothetical protein
MRAFARFILVKVHDKAVLINVAQIEAIVPTDDDGVCEIYMIGNDEDEYYHADHTLQDMISVIDEAAEVFIAGPQSEPKPVTLPEVESIGQKQN